MNIKCTSKPTELHPVTTQIPCFKQMFCLSLLKNTNPRRPVASADIHTSMETVQHGDSMQCLWQEEPLVSAV